MTLQYAIERGLKEEASRLTKDRVAAEDPLAIINEDLIPALDIVGKRFEKGTLFLPQLLMSADAAKEAFAVLKETMDRSGVVQDKKGKIILATVKGDIHDIGKNIVKVLLENYGFDVIDLGKDVEPETNRRDSKERAGPAGGIKRPDDDNVVNMEETIRLLRKEKPDCQGDGGRSRLKSGICRYDRSGFLRKGRYAVRLLCSATA